MKQSDIYFSHKTKGKQRCLLYKANGVYAEWYRVNLMHRFLISFKEVRNQVFLGSKTHLHQQQQQHLSNDALEGNQFPDNSFHFQENLMSTKPIKYCCPWKQQCQTLLILKIWTTLSQVGRNYLWKLYIYFIFQNKIKATECTLFFK